MQSNLQNAPARDISRFRANRPHFWQLVIFMSLCEGIYKKNCTLLGFEKSEKLDVILAYSKKFEKY